MSTSPQSLRLRQRRVVSALAVTPGDFSFLSRYLETSPQMFRYASRFLLQLSFQGVIFRQACVSSLLSIAYCPLCCLAAIKRSDQVKI
jgi:hypothetical protein